MSAPDTNLKKQKKKHKGPLIGMGAGIAFAAVLLVLLVAWLAFSGNEPDTAETQIEGTTGEVVDGDSGEPVTE